MLFIFYLLSFIVSCRFLCQRFELAATPLENLALKYCQKVFASDGIAIRCVMLNRQC